MRLIDADATSVAINRAINDYAMSGCRNVCIGFAGAVDIIDDMPTIDPVKHGQWIAGGDMYDEYFTCSNCEEPFVIFDVSKFYYCPNCGARMDGDCHD